MKCANHPEIDAVATCVDCGRGLCSACADKFSIPICDYCNLGRIGGEQKIILKDIIITAFLAFIGYCWAGYAELDLGTRFVAAYSLAGFIWGWRALTQITPRVFLFLPLIGWFFYFAIKASLALFVGFVALPWKAFTLIRDWLRIR